MAPHSREILLIGSVPVRPVEEVFRVVARHLGTRARRIPDGEMMDWLRYVWLEQARNPALERDGLVQLHGAHRLGLPAYRLKEGVRAQDLVLGPYGYADNARASYAAFKKLRDSGEIPSGTRYQCTIAGPGTTVFTIHHPAEELLPRAAAALIAEIEEIVRIVPPTDLAIQLDVAMEAEHEEYVRRPRAFDTPVHKTFHWTMTQMADAVASVANRIPDEVELGFHICSIWHHDAQGGQDNEVLVDAANILSERITRPIAYIHIPIIPEHDKPADYAPLGKLRLHRETKLFLGLVNLADGLEGARKRIELASSAVADKDFGISFFCGLGIPVPGKAGVDALTALMVEVGFEPVGADVPISRPAPPHPGLVRATAQTIDHVLGLHRKAAEF